MTGDMQEYYHMRKHIRHIADADGRNEFVGNQNPAVEFPPTLRWYDTKGETVTGRWVLQAQLPVPEQCFLVLGSSVVTILSTSGDWSGKAVMFGSSKTTTINNGRVPNRDKGRTYRRC